MKLFIRIFKILAWICVIYRDIYPLSINDALNKTYVMTDSFSLDGWDERISMLSNIGLRQKFL